MAVAEGGIGEGFWESFIDFLAMNVLCNRAQEGVRAFGEGSRKAATSFCRWQNRRANEPLPVARVTFCEPDRGTTV
jgi:hypothetical protein